MRATGVGPLYLDPNMIQEPRNSFGNPADEIGNTHAHFEFFEMFFNGITIDGSAAAKYLGLLKCAWIRISDLTE